MGLRASIFIVIAVCVFNGLVYAQPDIPSGWLTYFERSGYLETPRYDETIAYFNKLAAASNYAVMQKIGTSPQDRDLYCMVVSREGINTPEEFRASGKPSILIINGIHSGEIGGKDASMLLLREILVTKEKQYLLDHVNLLVVPVFSVDGHERFGPYNRINQNGPREMGWRTTAQNYNLNRDWMKADAPEMQAMLKLITRWLPDFIIDTHATNGADYQYTVTYIMDNPRNLYSETGKWLSEIFIPHLERDLEKRGYPAFPYVYMRNWYAGIESGLSGGATPPRFSNGYATLQNRPGIVVETHMLKPYKDRVFGTKATIESVLEYAFRNPKLLVEMNKRADEKTLFELRSGRLDFPLEFSLTEEYELRKFKGYRTTRELQPVSGAQALVYTSEPVEYDVKFYNDLIVKQSVKAPQAYLIPREWSAIVDRMRLHGIEVHELLHEETLMVTRFRFRDISFAPQSYEGRQRVDVKYETFTETATVPPGTFIVPTDQRTIRIILHLLEPGSGDSFLRWGFFNSIFERKEYFEMYVMEPIAQKMMEEDPTLKAAFERRLAEDEEFRNDPAQRLNYFYERSPYFDSQFNLYPVIRVE